MVNIANAALALGVIRLSKALTASCGHFSWRLLHSEGAGEQYISAFTRTIYMQGIAVSVA